MHFFFQENLTKNSDRKRAAFEAATLLACQQGLLEATVMVVSDAATPFRAFDTVSVSKHATVERGATYFSLELQKPPKKNHTYMPFLASHHIIRTHAIVPYFISGSFLPA